MSVLSTTPISREAILGDLNWSKEDLRRAILDARRQGYKVILRHISDGIATEYYFYTDEASMKKALAEEETANEPDEEQGTA